MDAKISISIASKWRQRIKFRKQRFQYRLQANRVKELNFEVKHARKVSVYEYYNNDWKENRNSRSQKAIHTFSCVRTNDFNIDVRKHRLSRPSEQNVMWVKCTHLATQWLRCLWLTVNTACSVEYTSHCKRWGLGERITVVRLRRTWCFVKFRSDHCNWEYLIVYSRIYYILSSHRAKRQKLQRMLLCITELSLYIYVICCWCSCV